MKAIQTTIYRCDFCNKVCLSISGAKNHERCCYYNPINKRKCLGGCEHLKKKKTVVYSDAVGLYGEYHEMERTVELFYCDKVESFLYPPAVERKGNAFETDPDDNQPMKKECSYFELFI